MFSFLTITPLRCSGLIVLVLFAFLQTGCGVNTVPVTGQVTIKGDPAAGKLQGYGVMLELAEPGADGKMVSATGEIDAAGKFVLGTNSGSDGAYPGKYRVAITPSSEFTEGAAPPTVIDRKYYNLQTSGLEAVVAAKANHFTWELDPASK
jgi:hypothetical protein